MKEYLLKAIEKGNSDGLYYLGTYYYLMVKLNASMMKKCLKLCIKYSNETVAKEYLLKHYQNIEFNKIQVKKYTMMLMAENSIITFQDMSGDPYMYDPDDEVCNYTLDENDELIKINMQKGNVEKILYDDEDDNYCEYVPILKDNSEN